MWHGVTTSQHSARGDERHTVRSSKDPKHVGATSGHPASHRGMFHAVTTVHAFLRCVTEDHDLMYGPRAVCFELLAGYLRTGALPLIQLACMGQTGSLA